MIDTLTGSLNGLLADFQVYGQKIRGFQWNVKGRDFFVLHEKFGHLYKEISENIDSVAERIRCLGGKPVVTFQDYLSMTTLKEEGEHLNTESMIRSLLHDIESIVGLIHWIIDEADGTDDPATVRLLETIANQQEKHASMFRSYLD
ncbi:DNA starvation/stationary phase protection protein [bacterium]|nr:DNA starvation/stationary phase protection protein [bacterium]